MSLDERYKTLLTRIQMTKMSHKARYDVSRYVTDIMRRVDQIEYDIDMANMMLDDIENSSDSS